MTHIAKKMDTYQAELSIAELFHEPQVFPVDLQDLVGGSPGFSLDPPGVRPAAAVQEHHARHRVAHWLPRTLNKHHCKRKFLKYLSKIPVTSIAAYTRFYRGLVSFNDAFLTILFSKQNFNLE